VLDHLCSSHPESRVLHKSDIVRLVPFEGSFSLGPQAITTTLQAIRAKQHLARPKRPILGTGTGLASPVVETPKLTWHSLAG
jgi:hypothetical protein